MVCAVVDLFCLYRNSRLDRWDGHGRAWLIENSIRVSYAVPSYKIVINGSNRDLSLLIKEVLDFKSPKVQLHNLLWQLG